MQLLPSALSGQGQQSVESIVNFERISGTLGTAGQPTPGQIAGIRAAGYEVVINLAMPTSANALPNEHELVEACGMEYVHIPVIWENPTAQNLDHFFEAMDRYRGRATFVHCAMNMRVSAFVFLYRVVRLGEPSQTAWAAVRRIWEPDATWQRFMDDSLARLGGSARPG